MSVAGMDKQTAEDIIESLRNGVPPRKGVSAYAAGTDFLEKVRRRHLDRGVVSGKIRFVNGSWGAGKTHFFRLLREHAFDADLLVSTVELTADQTPFNKFERVLYEIVRNITSPAMYRNGNLSEALPFGEVLREALDRRSGESDSRAAAAESLADEVMQREDIDIDVRRVVTAYWKTFTAEETELSALADQRGTLLQWFEGEGQATALRREFGVQKMVTKENARIILSSLGHFVKWLGFAGLLILLDESEMTHSTMRKASLKQAHNNLLHLINEVGETEGLFLIYAAVPDFFNDPRTGIGQYGALAARVGKLASKPPATLDKIWNLDYLETSDEHYLEAASNIREIYTLAYPDESDELIGEAPLHEHVVGLIHEHPEFASVSAWRMVITGIIQVLDRSLEGEDIPTPAEHNKTILAALQDD
ncbi:MAG: DUF2791 family P-loop domain-containing protein [Microbacteriaceae bacterium]|nr:DUF2791 family P-loop domain-containing protein [Microbacteriaceae bacterium]